MNVSAFLPFVPLYLAALALLLAMILALATGVERLHRISGWIFAPAVLIGLGLYLAAFLLDASGGVVRAVLQAAYSACGMFLGRQDYGSIRPLLDALAGDAAAQRAIDILFWVTHLGALFVTAAAVLSTLGKKLLQALRLNLLFFGSRKLYLIFGLHGQSAILGEDLARLKRSVVLYVDAKAPPALAAQVEAAGAIVKQRAPMRKERLDPRLMRQVGLFKGCRIKKIRVLILNEEERDNIALVRAVIRHLEDCRIAPSRVSIDLRCSQELDYAQLRQFESSQGNRYDVNVFSDAELSARLLVHASPPHEVMTFDADGVAQNDFHALIIGFDQVGQQTLRQIIMNGQFHGSRFTVDVVDGQVTPDADRFARRYPGVMDAYAVRFHALDARSNAFYQKLDEWAGTLRYIVICRDSQEENYEITTDLERYFLRFAAEARPLIVVTVCNRRFVASTMRENIRFFNRHDQVYSGRIFLREMQDRMAKAVNLNYFEEMHQVFDAEEAWQRADYFSRSSSRASADFIPAMLKIMGAEKGQELDFMDRARFNARVKPRSRLLESLGITEHLRWNAFHFAKGYTAMPLEEVRARAAGGIEPCQKDMLALKHACLVPWDGLDAVSAEIGALTGKPGLDYKGMDMKNVYEIPRALALWSEIDREEAGLEA